MGFKNTKLLFLFFFSLSLIFESIRGASELSQAGVVSGADIGVSGNFQIKTSVGQPFATVIAQGQNSVLNVGVFSGLDNAVVSSSSGQIDGVRNQSVTLNYDELLSVFGAYDPDGDSISILVEPILGSIGSDFFSLQKGQSVYWTPPNDKNGLTEALKVSLNDGRLSEIVQSTLNVMIDPFGEPVSANEFVMITAQLSVNGLPALDGDLVAAYVNGELRGRGSIHYKNGKPLVNINIANFGVAEEVGFKFYQRSSELILDQTLARAEIEPGKVIGSEADPLVIDMNTLTDITAPNLELVGESEILLGLRSVYQDPGASAIDNWDGDIGSSVVVSGVVDTSQVGEYELRYNVSDAAGNEAVEVVRKVVVDAFGPANKSGVSSVILASVVAEGILLEPGDRVGAFVGSELKAVQNVQFLEEEYFWAASVYILGEEEELTFKLYDQSAGRFYESKTSLSVRSNEDIGKLNDPFIITFDESPVADAGDAQTVNEGSVVTLDGSRSSNPRGGELSYEWIAPAGITLSSTTAVNPSFTAPEVGENTNYIFKLIVNDGVENSIEAVVQVTVKNQNKELIDLTVARIQNESEPAIMGFRFKTTNGVRYQIEVSSDLKKWKDILLIEGTGDEFQFKDNRPSQEITNNGFYRVKVID